MNAKLLFGERNIFSEVHFIELRMCRRIRTVILMTGTVQQQLDLEHVKVFLRSSTCTVQTVQQQRQQLHLHPTRAFVAFHAWVTSLFPKIAVPLQQTLEHTVSASCPLGKVPCCTISQDPAPDYVVHSHTTVGSTCPRLMH